jgi:hypothetical protein
MTRAELPRDPAGRARAPPCSHVWTARRARRPMVIGNGGIGRSAVPNTASHHATWEYSRTGSHKAATTSRSWPGARTGWPTGQRPSRRRRCRRPPAPGLRRRSRRGHRGHAGRCPGDAGRRRRDHAVHRRRLTNRPGLGTVSLRKAVGLTEQMARRRLAAQAAGLPLAAGLAGD